MRASSSTATATTEATTSASTTSRAVPHLDVLRVSQVDAARLDGELVDVLGNQLTRVVDAARATTRGRATDTKSTREMRLALDLALFACTTGVNRATPGQELMNLRFRDERTTTTSRATLKTGVEGDGLSVAQRLVYGSVKCVAAYAWGSWQRKMLREKFDEEEDASCWRRRAWSWSRAAENYYTLASFVNFCVFLRHGRYPTLLERVLGARLVYQRPSMARVVDFEHLNQQLAWRELSELVLFTLPYLYSTRVRAVFGALASSASSSTRDDADQPSSSERRFAVRAYRCVACARDEPVHPFVAEPCGHPYCYYCLRARLVERPSKCPCVKCFKPIERMRRLATTTTGGE